MSDSRSFATSCYNCRPNKDDLCLRYRDIKHFFDYDAEQQRPRDESRQHCLLSYVNMFPNNKYHHVHLGNLKRKAEKKCNQGRGNEKTTEFKTLSEIGSFCNRLGIYEEDVQAVLCGEYNREKIGWEGLTNGAVRELFSWGRKRDMTTGQFKVLLEGFFDVDTTLISNQNLYKKIRSLCDSVRNKKRVNKNEGIMDDVFVFARKEMKKKQKKNIRIEFRKSTNSRVCRQCRRNCVRPRQRSGFKVDASYMKKVVLRLKKKIEKLEEKIDACSVRFVKACAKNRNIKKRNDRMLNAMKVRKETIIRLNIELCKKRKVITSLENRIFMLKKIVRRDSDLVRRRQQSRSYLKAKNKINYMLRKENNRMKKKMEKMTDKINKLEERLKADSHVVELKEGGRYSDEVRSVVQELVCSMGVSTRKGGEVVKTVLEGLCNVNIKSVPKKDF
ncbi:uncharacterized protein LOC121418219 [Lytechinus variegatus]|uniref:uncharacterized protein LOC121418219 n=1 Tax=Lytechinus variegatus TaxID=7654 RepID=UPI001BB1DC70|nr:uncharacterized protein LOC121418219 [Lytechinus variegatus]